LVAAGPLASAFASDFVSAFASAFAAGAGAAGFGAGFATISSCVEHDVKATDIATKAIPLTDTNLFIVPPYWLNLQIIVPITYRDPDSYLNTL
jgi:hypothetical protein